MVAVEQSSGLQVAADSARCHRPTAAPPALYIPGLLSRPGPSSVFIFILSVLVDSTNMTSSLDQLKASGTVVVCDSGDFASTWSDI